MASDEGSEWLRDFRELCHIDSIQFADCWNHYDEDGNGYIEGDEIDSFFSDIMDTGVRAKKLSQAEKDQMRRDFMKEFDENGDGKIELNELAKILPPEDNFLTIFRKDNNFISGKDFMQIWRKYATNKKDHIESEALEAFLHDLFLSLGREVSSQKLQEYATSIVRLYDDNGDGKLSFKEMSRLLPESENVLLRFKDRMNLTPENFDDLFRHYDQDGNGSISGEELEIFLKDVALSIQGDVVNNPKEFDKLKMLILNSCDESGDGDLQKDEIALWLGIGGK